MNRNQTAAPKHQRRFVVSYKLSLSYNLFNLEGKLVQGMQVAHKNIKVVDRLVSL